MLVKILVTAEIEPIDDGPEPPLSRLSEDKLRASVCEAVDNTQKFGMDTGFEHALSEHTSIHISSVELLDEDPTCYFHCESCGRLVTASTSDVKSVGAPMCGDCDEEMEELTEEEYRDLEREDDTESQEEQP